MPPPDPKGAARRATSCSKTTLVRVVLDAPEHPSDLAPSGGSIIDLAPKADRLRRSDQLDLSGGGAAARATPSTTRRYETDEHGGQDGADASRRSSFAATWRPTAGSRS